MKYNINLENVQRIIQSDTVPEDDNEGLVIDLEHCEVTIKKPYTDSAGDEMGNSIYVDFNDGRVFYFRIQDEQYLFVFYRSKEQETFETLGDDSPAPVKDLAQLVWRQIIDDMEEREKAWNGVVPKMEWGAFAAQFGAYEVPDLLKHLFNFQEKEGMENFSECFYLHTIDKAGLKTFSEKESFIHSFIEFAMANGTGSTYAFWVRDKDLSKCPVVVFGDEGGVHVIAESIIPFLLLLTYDTEITVSWEEAYYFKDEDDECEESIDRRAFLKWMKANTGFNGIETEQETKKILQSAKEKYQPALIKFLTDNGIEL